MKRLISILVIATAAIFASPSLLLTSCSAPSTHVVAVQSLKAVGQSAEAAMNLSIQLYKDGRITAAQAREINAFYDVRFQPAYRVAVAAVQTDLSQPAPAQVIDLATQLINLVNSYVK
jgi:hypothetical protein